jgi:hypothetical protein
LWPRTSGLCRQLSTPQTDQFLLDCQFLREQATRAASSSPSTAATTWASAVQPGLGLGQHTLASAIALLLANHLGTETGEIAVLKGIQGARGYPM